MAGRLVLTYPELELGIAADALILQYSRTPDFVACLHDVATRHRHALEEIRKLLAKGPVGGEEEVRRIRDAILEGRDPRAVFFKDEIERSMVEVAEVRGIAACEAELTKIRREWNLVGEDERWDLAWAAMTFEMLLRVVLELEPPEIVNADHLSFLLRGTADTHFVRFSALDVTRRGARQVARGLAPLLAGGLRRPRPRSNSSIVWLYQRRALHMLPDEIAERHHESADVVRKLIRRDKKLLGLKSTPGWPAGRRKVQVRGEPPNLLPP